jgi:hypothetical protein
MISNKTIQTIIWNYGGTLVDTRQQNYYITKTYLPALADINQHHFPTLSTLAYYVQANLRSINCRGLYQQGFSLSKPKLTCQVQQVLINFLKIMM